MFETLAPLEDVVMKRGFHFGRSPHVNAIHEESRAGLFEPRCKSGPIVSVALCIMAGCYVYVMYTHHVWLGTKYKGYFRTEGVFVMSRLAQAATKTQSSSLPTSVPTELLSFFAAERSHQPRRRLNRMEERSDRQNCSESSPAGAP